jgi:hypothetical protein
MLISGKTGKSGGSGMGAAQDATSIASTNNTSNRLNLTWISPGQLMEAARIYCPTFHKA